ncbi:hypothetical protein [Bradyrhizobium sp. JYMT SZCCT0180]|uniref:hypothetical protein n=1 Tax=Bradyrhizobium sp. JYMT SZCCT0180 TaxID=2807666 RepID=UPI001BA5D773|nr:hypothetical protein [Bradyrhizobium sp. JYMT SZCCT0180]MBR1211551.1 hypothetical protein [Bradyrhizobium sp. JYMT SZCCT0180]
MTRHRTITGFVAVALLAVAATAATMRSSPVWTNSFVVPAGTTMPKGLAVDELPAASFDDRWSAMSTSATSTPERTLADRQVPLQ